MSQALAAAATSRRPDAAYSWAVAAATLVMASLSFGAVTSIPILFAPIAREFGWSYSRVASVHTLAMFGAGIGSIVLGRILDRRGFFVIAVVASFATGLGLYLVSVAGSLAQMALPFALLVGGLGQGAFFSPLVAAVSHWFERHRALAVAIALSGQSVGGLLVPPLLRVAAEEVGWRSALQAYGLVCSAGMLGAALLYLARPPAPGETAGAAGGAASASGGRGGLGLLAAALFCSNTANFGIAGHMVSYGEYVGFGPAAAGTLMSALFGVTLFSRLGVGHLLARGGTYGAMFAMTALHALGAWLVVLSSAPWQLVAGLLCLGIGFGGYLPAYGALVRSMFPAHQAGRRLTELYLLSFLGAGSGTWAVGALRDARAGAFDLAFVAMAVLASCACLALATWRRGG